jgi:4'-phosphopantetheinyl transferase
VNAILLAANRVDVLCAGLERPADEMASLHATLAEDERERAARFRFEIHRRRFIAARGLLRQALSEYLGIAPAEIRFSYGARGKPAIIGSPLQFNVSHSEELAVYAFSLDMPLGVDVEHVRRLEDLEGIAQRFFSPGEWALIEARPPEERIDAFFRCWTRKEAYIKATGDGLSYPLNEFDVSVNGPAKMLTIGGNPAEASQWSMHDLALPEGYVGALAFRGTGFEIFESYLP